MTRALTVICLALVASLPLSAHARGSARELADDCRSLLQAKTGAGEQIRIPFTKKALVCWGYMQAMQDLSALADEDGRRIMGACPPERTTLLELIQAFVSYARSHAGKLPDNAALAVSRALHEAFPCETNGLGFRRPSGPASWRRNRS
jgi:Rap1a immunity proteins